MASINTAHKDTEYKTVYWSTDANVLLRSPIAIPSSDMTNIEYYNTFTKDLIILMLVALFCNEHLIMVILIAMIIMLYRANIQNVPTASNEGFQDTQKCQAPTADNPFMNGLAGDNPTRPEACKTESAQDQAKAYLDHNLFKDVNEIWEENNSQRQYYTNPSTTYPNDREAFTDWVYATPYACKSGDMNHCLEYEDLRVPGYS